ncbi:Autophagy-related protein 28 [Fulvia fulva]|uniref:Autophagy-related protein 28 n=1 Tax=Passalora fulva TaxID=5499 RepID=A0A9Q8P4E0_PASFU|nr:Autophagy-related protein 28 [Fulvia fulva]KAK4634847.1 Autophagy-related protein 28 [Fulvia fulva]KAK4636868.1 Autophagy-related protein 28 [Fulvia fulva]UJO12883.1 Autophagy-related protein 28 [Fulvia fulva]WPV08868.1 Autophagy-related protein 28 [Fulvia fulva]WPV23154.1 Autophagy-related protein 28 [Fulvia fulva]
MPSGKSWYAQASSSKARLSNSSHELPRWTSPSPSASIIPPPIVQSVAQLPSNAPTQSTVIERPSPIEDRHQELEADLQFLLDAQAEGLIRGLGDVAVDDRSSTSSTTPTAQSVRSASARRTRKPARRQLGLRSARKGIYNAISALSALKDDEIQDVCSQLQDDENTLAQIDDWEAKRKGLEEVSDSVDESGETVRVQRLKQEADTLQTEINTVELQLMEMKSRHRKLLKQAAAVENSVQAKMASYTSSLHLLEEEVQRFLSAKPYTREERSTSSDGQQSMWQLPPNRRNLDMAKQYWTEQRESTVEMRKQHEQERAALVEGAQLWKETVMEVTDLERQIRDEMTGLRPISPESPSAWDDAPPSQPVDHSRQLKNTLGKMQSVISSVEGKLQKAEDNRWSLLMAAIGAELDALKRGKEILAGVLGVTEPDLMDANGHDSKDDSPGEDIRGLDKSFETARLDEARSPQRKHEDDDHDEPDPELLFSRQDIDNE